MADRLRVLYFLEDRLQQGFLVPLVERIARDVSIPREALWHDVRSATGGSAVLEQFGRFVRDLRRLKLPGAEIIVVAVDADCKGYAERAGQLRRKVRDTDPFRDIIVYAIPDPHIERWYLLDQQALRDGVGLERGIEVPAYKCRRDYYKSIFRSALREQRVPPALGGSEFGRDIALSIADLYAAGKQDPSFARFVEDIKRVLRQAYRTTSPGQ